MKGTANKEKISVRGYTRKRVIPSAKTLANLIPPKKGEIRNPAGRPPKDVSITSLLKVLLETPTSELPWPREKLTWGQTLALSWVKRAITEEGLFNTLLDRVEGKMPIAINIRAELERLAKSTGVPKADILAEYELLSGGKNGT